MKKYIHRYLLLFFCLLPLAGWGQERIIRGLVSDQSGPLPGASIYLQNPDQRILVGVITNENGEYLINIPEDAGEMTVIVSFVGYKSFRVKYKGQKVLNVKLIENQNVLEGVNVVAKAIERNNMGINEDDLGVAREKIDISEFQDMSVTSVEDMLQGKLANVDIIAASGDPGAKSTIRIRGTASLNASNEPLIVIDDIPQDTEIDPDFSFGDADVEDFGSLLNISPNDILSIEVLKDAAATSLWGPRAANGVLVIKTKGGGNHKPYFSFSEKLNMTFEPEPIAMLNGKEYVSLMQEALWNWVRDGGFAENRVNKLNNQKDIRYDPTYKYFDEFNCNTDWLDLVTRNSLNTTTDFSMSGGGEKASYRFSLGYESQNGTTVGTGFNRITSRLNLDYKFSKRFSVSTKFNYAESKREEPFTDNGSYNSPRAMAMNKMPNMSPYVLDAEGNPTDEYFAQPEDCIQGRQPNPVALVNESHNMTNTREVGAAVSTSFMIVRGLRLNATVSFDMQTAKNKKFLPESVNDVLWSNADYNKGVDGMVNKAHTYANIRLNYNRSFKGGHQMTLGASEQLEASSNNSSNVTTSGNGAYEVSDPSAGGKITQMNSGKSKNRTVGLSFSGNYNYKDRYAITLSGRMNANSNTGRENRWKKPRPSVSAVWKVDHEKFMKPLKWVNEFRIRGSWGRSERTPSSNYTTGTFASEVDYIDRPSIKPQQMQLNKLRPEIVTQYNAGLDGIFWKNRINVTFEIYSKKTTDMLQKNMSIQSTTGYSQIRYYNSGAMLNRGWELMVNLNDIIQIGKLKISFRNLNLSRNRNRVEELPYNMEQEQFTIANGKYAHKIIAGHPVGSFYGFRFDGIYQNTDETIARDASGKQIVDIQGNPVYTRINGTWRQRPGDARYADLNHDGNINEYDIVYLGNSYPILTGGGAVNFAYKNWSLRASFHFRLGQSVISDVRHNLEKMNGGGNQSVAVLRRWHYEGEDTDIPRALWGTNYNSLGSDKFVEDASFLKCKDITLNYRLPSQFIKRLHLRRASVFLTSYNLFTITKYKGQDPEIGVGEGAYGLARDNSKTPPSRRVAIGLSFDF